MVPVDTTSAIASATPRRTEVSTAPSKRTTWDEIFCSAKYLASKTGPIRDALLLNSGLTIAAFNGAHEKDIYEQIKNGIESAIDAIDSGKALKLLNDWGAFTQEFGGKA